MWFSLFIVLSVARLGDARYVQRPRVAKSCFPWEEQARYGTVDYCRCPFSLIPKVIKHGPACNLDAPHAINVHFEATQDAWGIKATMECDKGWYGEVCDRYCEDAQCGKWGKCGADGYCQCEIANMYGDACTSFCESDQTCEGLGECNSAGTCECRVQGYYGPHCTWACDAATTCHGHGTCSGDLLACDCFPGYYGDDCSQQCTEGLYDLKPWAFQLCNRNTGGIIYCADPQLTSTALQIGKVHNTDVDVYNSFTLTKQNGGGHWDALNQMCECSKGWFRPDCAVYCTPQLSAATFRIDYSSKWKVCLDYKKRPFTLKCDAANFRCERGCTKDRTKKPCWDEDCPRVNKEIESYNKQGPFWDCSEDCAGANCWNTAWSGCRASIALSATPGKSRKYRCEPNLQPDFSVRPVDNVDHPEVAGWPWLTRRRFISLFADYAWQTTEDACPFVYDSRNGGNQGWHRCWPFHDPDDKLPYDMNPRKQYGTGQNGANHQWTGQFLEYYPRSGEQEDWQGGDYKGPRGNLYRTQPHCVANNDGSNALVCYDFMCGGADKLVQWLQEAGVRTMTPEKTLFKDRPDFIKNLRSYFASEDGAWVCDYVAPENRKLPDYAGKFFWTDDYLSYDPCYRYNLYRWLRASIDPEDLASKLGWILNDNGQPRMYSRNTQWIFYIKDHPMGITTFMCGRNMATPASEGLLKWDDARNPLFCNPDVDFCSPECRQPRLALDFPAGVFYAPDTSGVYFHGNYPISKRTGQRAVCPAFPIWWYDTSAEQGKPPIAGPVTLDPHYQLAHHSLPAFPARHWHLLMHPELNHRELERKVGAPNIHDLCPDPKTFTVAGSCTNNGKSVPTPFIYHGSTLFSITERVWHIETIPLDDVMETHQTKYTRCNRDFVIGVRQTVLSPFYGLPIANIFEVPEDLEYMSAAEEVGNTMRQMCRRATSIKWRLRMLGLPTDDAWENQCFFNLDKQFQAYVQTFITTPSSTNYMDTSWQVELLGLQNSTSPNLFGITSYWSNETYAGMIKWGPKCEHVCDEAVQCNGHGGCNPDDGTCICQPPYSGKTCGCTPDKCGPNGTCDPDTGKCLCKDGWQGATCNTKVKIKCDANQYPTAVGEQNCDVFCLAETSCSDHGTCSPTGKCVCDDGYYGENCSTYCTSEETCNGRGKCNAYGLCECDDPLFKGRNCDCNDEATCGPHGKCAPKRKINPKDKCDCDDNYFTDFSGPSIRFCANHCDPKTCVHGTCQSTGCVCEQGWYGAQCDKQCQCKNGALCGSQGCECAEGYGGTFCEIRCDSATQCNGKGRCMADNMAGAKCECEDGYYGAQCERYCDDVETCHRTESGQNFCLTRARDVHADEALLGTCVCAKGFAAPDCQFQCSDTDRVCSGNGKCGDDGTTCVCDAGWVGARCDMACDAAQQCKGRGTCRADGTGCDCQPGFRGDFCEYAPAKDCTDCKNGSCANDGTCICDSGYFGETCSKTCDHCDGGYCDYETGECHCAFGRDVTPGTAKQRCVIDAPPGTSIVPTPEEIEEKDYCKDKQCPTHATCDPGTGACLCLTDWYPVGKCDVYCDSRKCTCNPINGKCLVPNTIGTLTLVITGLVAYLSLTLVFLLVT